MYHQVTVAGHLGSDPEMRYMPDGTPLTNFSIATNIRSGNTDQTIWFRVSVWGKQAETVHQYLSKGRAALVTGRLQFDPATGGPKTFVRNDGTAGASFEVRADRVVFLSGSQADGDGGGRQSVGRGPEEDSEIPF